MQLAVVEDDLADLLRRQPDLEHALVDGGARARGALVVHRGLGGLPTVRRRLEHDDLGVLAAEFDDGADVRVKVLHGQRDRVHLLHELRADAGAEGQGTRPRQEHPPRRPVRRREQVLDRRHHLQDLLGLFGLMPLIVAVEHLERLGVQGDDLDGGRADVDPDHDGPVVTCEARGLGHGRLSAEEFGN
jgi:hypothetical protein